MRVFLLCLLFAASAGAQEISKPVLPADVVKKVIAVNTQLYWGKAKTKDGKVIAAESPEKAKLPPIPAKDAERIIDNAVPTGAAEFCRIEWKSYRDSYFTLEQKQHSWSEAQMVFVGTLFQSTHDLVLVSMKRSYKCTDDIRNRTAEKLSDAEKFVAQELGAPVGGEVER